MFKAGDRVKFLNDVGGGVVTRVDNKIVYVENQDGFEVPSMMSQLLLVGALQTEYSPFTEVAPLETGRQGDEDDAMPVLDTENVIDYVDLSEEPDEPNTDTFVNILLAWIPKQKKNSLLAYDLYLINDCGYNIMYVAAMINEATYCGIQAGMLESEATIHLTRVSEDDLKSLKKIRFDVIFFKKGSYLPHEPMRYSLKINDFYISDPVNYQTNAYFDDKALIYNISEEYLTAEIENVAIEIQKQSEKQKKEIDNNPPVSRKKKPEKELEEVDLHIEQLVDNPKALSPQEMLDIQLGRFTIALEGAILNRGKRIVFIHGVGNGRLRLEIQRLLDKKHPKLRYQDASFKEYGFGATMVFL